MKNFLINLIVSRADRLTEDHYPRIKNENGRGWGFKSPSVHAIPSQSILQYNNL